MKMEAIKGLLAKYLPYLTILAGCGLVFLSIVVDFVGLGGSAGFGPRQINLAFIGVLVGLVGILAVPPVRERLLFRWVMPPATYQQPASSVGRRFAQVILVSLWIGLLLGLSDLFYIGDQKLVSHDIVNFGGELVWMAPLAGLFIGGVAGLALSLISWRWPGVASIRTVVSLLGFLFFLNLAFIILPQVHWAASLVLGLGMALLAARAIAFQPKRFYGLARRTILPLVAFVAVLTGVVLVGSRISENRAYAALAPSVSGAPNVVLITLDTVRARSFSLYGYDRPTTPYLEKFATRSVTFDWAISTSPWTLPSHASMFTGRFPHELSADFTVPLDDTYPTLAEVLYSKGYETSGFVANHWYGLTDFGLNRGMIHYDVTKVTPWEVMRSVSIVREGFRFPDRLGKFTGELRGRSRKKPEQVNSEFLGWLAGREDSDRPFFTFLNYIDAHDPYEPPPRFALQFAGKEKPMGTWDKFTKPTPEEIRELNNAYDASIAYLDEQLGELFGELEKQGLLDNTLIVVTSDHGEQLGEHGLTEHGNSLYLPLIHVPLIISFPGRVPADVRIHQPVSLRDMSTTVLDLLDIENRANLPGDSLARFWNGELDIGETVNGKLLSEVTQRNWIAEWNPTYQGDMKSLLGDYQLYIKDPDGREELYDIIRDPLEQNNLALAEDSQPALKDFRAVMQGLPVESSFRSAAASGPTNATEDSLSVIGLTGR